MIAEYLAIGPEGLDAALVQRSTQFLTEELAALGVELRWKSSVGEDRQRLERALAHALERCDCVFLVGGMGPGGFTRQTVAEGLELPLVVHRESREAVRAVFGRRDGSLPAQYEALAMVPQGAAVFSNKRGLSPGCALEADGQCIVLLPADFREMQSMVLYSVYHYLLPLLDRGAAVGSLRVYGKTAKEIAAALSGLMQSRNPLLAIYPEEGEVLVRATALAQTVKQAERLCEPMIREAAERLGTVVYGAEEDTLADATIQALRRAGLKAAGAEYGTEGLLGRLFAAAEDPHDVLETVAYAARPEELTDVLGVHRSTMRRDGMSLDTVAAMAAGAARTFETALGVAVILATREGGAIHAHVAVSDGLDVWLRDIPLPEGEKPARAALTACKAAIDLLRLYARGASDRLPEPCRAPSTTRRGPWYQRVLPWRGDRGADLARKISVLATAVVVICGGIYIGTYAWSQLRGLPVNTRPQSSVASVPSTSSSEPEPDYPTDFLPQFASWWKINPDIAGEVAIADTELEYTVVQTEDNEYYQNRNFYDERDRSGAPYVDYRVNLREESVNTVVYAQNSPEDPLFAELKQYKSLEYYQKHPIVRFDSLYREGTYKVLGVCVVNTWPDQGEVWAYQNFIDGTDAELTAYIEQVKERSLIETTVDVQPGDKLLTLSTNTEEIEDARFVVVARKLRADESLDVDVESARLSESPLLPQGYPGTDLAVSSSGVSSVSSAASASTPSSSAASSSAAPSSSSAASSSSVASSIASSSSSSRVSSSSQSSEVWIKPSSVPEESESSESESESSDSGDGWIKPSSSSEPEESSESQSEPEDNRPSEGGGPIAMDEMVRVNGVEMSAYDAVCQMTMNEMGGTFHKEAQKAQAIAIYSRLVARGGTVSGIGLRTPNSTVKQLVTAVWGETIQSNGKAVDAYFCASSAGMTNTSKEVWGGVVPGHTQNVESYWDESSPGYKSTKRMTYQDVIDRIYDKLSVDLEGLDEEEWFEVLSRTGGDYIDQIRIGGEKKVSGRYLRENVLNLRSACFEWEFTGDYVIFTTYGYGHGCGLSQYGANGMASEGYSYVEILEHYYAGCTVG